MSATGFLSLQETADRLSVSKEQVRRYVQRGLVPAAKLGNCWIVPAAHIQALEDNRPNGGRPLSAETVWAQILAEDVDLDDPWRYFNRGSLSRWNGTPGAVTDLMVRSDVVVSGLHAAQFYHGLLAPLREEAHIYVEQSTTTTVMDGFVFDPLGGVTVRSVDAGNWQMLKESAKTPPRRPDAPVAVTARCAPVAAVALDLVLSPHPRERDVAARIMNQQ